MTPSQDNPDLAVRRIECDRAVSKVDAALTIIERRAGPPDYWQLAFLAQAIGMVFAGLYHVVRTDVLLAMTPERERDRGALPTLPPDPIYERLSLTALRAALHEAQSAPVG